MATIVEHIHRDQAGEGVISAAIVVLIMAVIGGAMFIIFSDAFGGASERITEEIDTIVDSVGGSLPGI